MMVFFILCCIKSSQNMRRVQRSYIHLIFLLLILLSPLAVVQAESIRIKSVNLIAAEEGYEISVDSEIALNATLEKALENGIVLYFATKFS